MQLKLFFDGSCNIWHKPISASYGFIIQHEGKTVNEVSKSIGVGPEMTNNLAEFEGLYQGLTKIHDSYGLDALRSGLVSVYGDSQLVIHIMNKKWRASSDKRYYPAYQRAVSIVKELRNNSVSVSFNWIPREMNTRG